MRRRVIRAAEKRSALGFGLAAVLALAAPSATAQEPAHVLLSLVLQPSSGGITGVLEADGVMEHRIYVTEDPHQVVVDILDVRNTVTAVRPTEPHPLLRHVLSDQLSMTAYDPEASGRTFARLTFELKRPVWHSLRKNGTRLELGLHAAADTVPDAASPTPAPASAALEPAVTGPEPEVEPGREPDAPSADARPLDESTVDGDAADPPLAGRIEPPDVSPDVFLKPALGGDEYRIGAEDVLEVRVFELEQLNRTVRVAADGSVVLPLIGPVAVAGLTAPQAADAIASELRGEFVDDPQVTLLITDHQSRRVSLLGAVERPGTYPLVGKSDLLELIASAQGLGAGAGSVLFVFRRLPDGRNARLSVPLQDLLVLGDPKWNIRLQPGDVVSIPPEAAISVSVVGSVGQPGVYKLPAGGQATLLRAVALAGGLKPRASKSVQVKRRDESGDETVIKVDLGDIMSGKSPDFVLREGDVVIVNQSFF